MASQRVQLSVNKSTPKGYEILFIHAGEANGWTFPEVVLQESVQLWQGVSLFVDHSMFGRSVHDLGGVLTNCRFFDGALLADLVPVGESRMIVEEYAQLMLSDVEPKPDVGFSADLVFTADQKNVVQKILQPYSVDLVIDPAFATKFIRSLNSRKKESDMSDENALNDTERATRELLQAQQKIHDEAQKAMELRVAMCNNLLESSLTVAALPAPAVADLRARFAGKAFEPKDLESAVKAWKESLQAIKSESVPFGATRISGMYDSGDQMQAAVDDLVGAPREKGAESLKVAQFRGLKDAYMFLSGDFDLTGGFFPDRLQFQHTTANFPGLVKNALNKAIAQNWDQLGRAGYDWWSKIATIEEMTSVNQITWLIVGTVGSLPTVAEGAEYAELKIGDGAETSNFVKYGGYIGVTLEAIDRDDTRKLRVIPREVANAAMRNISEQVAGIFTSNSAVGPTLADTGALFNSTAVTTAGGHANLLTTALGTDYTAWNTVAAAVYNQPMLIANETGYIGTGKKQAVDPRYCLVPRALKTQAETLFVPRWEATAQNVAAVSPTWGGRVEVLTVPEWTDTNDWAAVVDPAIVPGIMIGTRFGIKPQIVVAGDERDGAMFNNDESRLKVRHFLAVGVANYRPLHKENV